VYSSHESSLRGYWLQDVFRNLYTLKHIPEGQLADSLGDV